MLPRSLRSRAPTLWLLIPFTLGLVLARLGLSVPLAGLGLAAVLLALLSLLFAFRQQRLAWALALVVSLFLTGLGVFELHREPVEARRGLPPREALLELRCERLFGAREKGRASGLARVVGMEAHLSELRGRRVYFSLATERSTLRVGAQFRALAVLGNLSEEPVPRSFEDFLADQGVALRFQRGKVLGVTKEASAYRRFCERVLRAMEKTLSQGLGGKEPELAAAYRAMVLGQLGELSEEQRLLYAHSGTMHLFSISGMHIGVIALVLHGLGTGLCRFQVPRALVVLGLLWLYVDATGCSPSALRAFLMVALVELALLFRRPSNALSCLVLSALGVLLLDPWQLFGASFVLSYGIVASLVLYAAPLSEWLALALHPWRQLPEAALGRPRLVLLKAWQWLLAALCAGVGASLVGLPAGVHFFGQLTPGALVVNLLLIPLSSLVLLAGLLALFLGTLPWLGLATLPNHASLVLLALMEKAATWSLKLPASYRACEFNSPLLGALAVTFVLLLCLVAYRLAWRPKWLCALLPPALMLAFLLLGLRSTAMP